MDVSAEAVIHDHLSADEARKSRFCRLSSAERTEAGQRAMSALRAMQIDRTMRGQGNYNPLPESALKMLKRQLAENVRRYIEANECPHCGQFVG